MSFWYNLTETLRSFYELIEFRNRIIIPNIIKLIFKRISRSGMCSCSAVNCGVLNGCFLSTQWLRNLLYLIKVFTNIIFSNFRKIISNFSID